MSYAARTVSSRGTNHNGIREPGTAGPWGRPKRCIQHLRSDEGIPRRKGKRGVDGHAKLSPARAVREKEPSRAVAGARVKRVDVNFESTPKVIQHI